MPANADRQQVLEAVKKGVTYSLLDYAFSAVIKDPRKQSLFDEISSDYLLNEGKQLFLFLMESSKHSAHPDYTDLLYQKLSQGHSISDAIQMTEDAFAKSHA